MVTKYEGSGKRAAIQGIVKGDYVLDAQVGAYQRFVGSGKYSSARSIDESDLETVDASGEMSYYFSPNEFSGGYAAEDLFNALPDAIKDRFGTEVAETARFITYLNQALEYTDLVVTIIKDMDNQVPQSELDSLRLQAQTMPKEDLVRLNRLSLEKLYEEICPATNTTGVDIIEVLPLVSVNIADPNSNYGDTEAARHTRGVMKATSYTDYKNKKASINAKFDSFYKLSSIKRFLPDWAKILVDPLPNGQATVGKPEHTLAADNSNSYGVALQYKSTVNSPTNISDMFELQPGIIGHFSITWGNIHCDASIGIYATGETGLTFSKTLYNHEYSQQKTYAETYPKPAPAAVNKTIHKTIDLINIPLNTFNVPVITIGVVYFKIGFYGYFKFPAEVYIAGDIVTTLYAGFTALYAAGIDCNVNYGIKFQKIKVLWFTISVPLPYLEPSISGKVIDDLVYYACVIRDIRGGELFQLQNAKIGFITRPSLTFGPALTLCDVVGIGVSAGPAIEMGVEVGVRQYNGKLTLNDVYGDFICGCGLDINLDYGIYITIPNLPENLRGSKTLIRYGLTEKRYPIFP